MVFDSFVDVINIVFVLSHFPYHQHPYANAVIARYVALQ